MRTPSYCFTVRMINGDVAPEYQEAIRCLRSVVKLGNVIFDDNKYVKLQGRLGKDNPNSWKYRPRDKGGIYGRSKCIRLADAATADVYVYQR